MFISWGNKITPNEIFRKGKTDKFEAQIDLSTFQKVSAA